MPGPKWVEGERTRGEVTGSLCPQKAEQCKELPEGEGYVAMPSSSPDECGVGRHSTSEGAQGLGQSVSLSAAQEVLRRWMGGRVWRRGADLAVGPHLAPQIQSSFPDLPLASPPCRPFCSYPPAQVVPPGEADAE